MHSFKKVVLCACSNFRKWKFSARVYMVGLTVLIFGFWSVADISQYAASRGLGVTPWLLSGYYFMPTLLSVYGFLVIMLFSNAPFADSHAPFLVVRTGRLPWILGQILYIFLAAFLLVFLHFCMIILLCLPNVGFSSDWGTIIRSIAIDPSLAGMSTILVNSEMVGAFTGPEATLLTMLLMWLVAVFLGAVVFAFNIISGKNTGIVIAGFFVFISFFSNYMGQLVFGSWLQYIAPVNWCSLYGLSWNGNSTLPGIPYAISVLSIGSIVLFILSGVIYCKKDMVFRKEEL